MRLSTAAAVLLTRNSPSGIEFLLQWNSGWQAYHFLGGHQRDHETPLACARRELCEELVCPPEDFQIDATPWGRLRYVAYSQRAGVQSRYDITLFTGQLRPEREELATAARENIWVTLPQIQELRTAGGEAISPTTKRLLEITGWFPEPNDPQLFTIGVTGHRDLLVDDLAEIESRLQQVFDDAERQAEGRSCRVISPLAAGADQMVARVALQRKYPLIVPLPFRLDRYEEDFFPAESQQLHALLQQSQVWFSLPENLAGRSIHRAGLPNHYAAVGKYVVDQSDLLVVLWDGTINHKPGGTSDTLRYAVQSAGLRPLRRHLGVIKVRRREP